METFGVMAMGMSIFGLLAWMQLQSVTKELKELKLMLAESGILKETEEKIGE